MREEPFGFHEVRDEMQRSGDTFRVIPGVDHPECSVAFNYNPINGDAVIGALIALLKMLDSGPPSDALLSGIARVRDDWIALNTSTCSLCGDKQCIHDEGSMGVEHARFSASWGYMSRKDGETHNLVLCENCYDERISQTMGEFVRVNDYFGGGRTKRRPATPQERERSEQDGGPEDA